MVVARRPGRPLRGATWRCGGSALAAARRRDRRGDGSQRRGQVDPAARAASACASATRVGDRRRARPGRPRRPRAGRPVGLVPQEPADLLWAETVAAECAAADRRRRGRPPARPGAARTAGARHRRGTAPARPVRGSAAGPGAGRGARRAAPVVLLDEPTRGLDYPAKAPALTAAAGAGGRRPRGRHRHARRRARGRGRHPHDRGGRRRGRRRRPHRVSVVVVLAARSLRRSPRSWRPTAVADRDRGGRVVAGGALMDDAAYASDPRSGHAGARPRLARRAWSPSAGRSSSSPAPTWATAPTHRGCSPCAAAAAGRRPAPRSPTAGIDAKAVALLGVLAAVGAALRPFGGGVTGFQPMFVVLILGRAGARPRVRVRAGAVTMFASALVTGGVGPWLPFQMLGAAWVGLGAGLLPRGRRTRRDRLAARGYGAVSGIAVRRSCSTCGSGRSPPDSTRRDRPSSPGPRSPRTWADSWPSAWSPRSGFDMPARHRQRGADRRGRAACR